VVAFATFVILKHNVIFLIIIKHYSEFRNIISGSLVSRTEIHMEVNPNTENMTF
jgi:hypothetical protein